MSTLATARALARSQHGPELLLAVAGVGIALALIGLDAAPSLDHGYPLHLFTTGPGVVAAVSSVATANKMSELNLPVDRRLAAFRALWCALVVTACCLLIWPAAVSMQRTEIVGSTGLLVALTFAASTVVRSAAWCVGAANTVVAMILPRLYPDADPATGWLRSAGSLAWLVIAAAVLVSAALYGALGDRSP